MTTYAKPAVRQSWGQIATEADLQDPGDTYASKGFPLGAKPPRQYANWVWNFTTAAVRYFCQQGISDWDAAESYPINAIVQGSDNRLYQAIQANTGINPVGGAAGNWGPIQGATPANSDHTNSLATTAWVNGNYLPTGTTIGSLPGTVTNAQIPVGAVTQWQGSLSIGGGQVSSAVSRSNTLLLSGTGNYASFQWIGQSGQPAWLFGSNDGANVFVWNPSNFSVANSALLAGLAPTSAAAGNTVMLRDASGFAYAQYLNQASGNNENPPISQFMVTNGSDGYLRKASVAAVAAALGVPALTFSSAGYQKIGTAIIQGGRAAINGGAVTVTFPIAFPNACFAVALVNEGNQNYTDLASPPSKTSFVAINGSAEIDWIAFGY